MTKMTFWYEFASTYSYPAALRIGHLSKQHGVEIIWKPFLLGPIFKAQGWPTSPFNLYPAKGAYMWRDIERICTDYKLPFQRPPSFPQNGLLAARIATYGMQCGWGASFSKGVYAAQFGLGKCIDDAHLLADLVQAAGGDPDEALQQAVADENKQRLKNATNEAISLGIFGAPSFVTEDKELFWGHDRLDNALRWANSGWKSTRCARLSRIALPDQLAHSGDGRRE